MSDNIINPEEGLNTGRFYNYAKEFIKSDYQYEYDLVVLLGAGDRFLEETAEIGSKRCSELILAGTPGHQARDLGFQEIAEFIQANIESYS